MKKYVLALGFLFLAQAPAQAVILVDTGIPTNTPWAGKANPWNTPSSVVVWLWLGKTEAALIVPLVIEQELLGFFWFGCGLKVFGSAM